MFTKEKTKFKQEPKIKIEQKIAQEFTKKKHK